MTRVFVPGIGFREPGLRLRGPVAQKASNGRTVTVTELVSTSDGSDLVYEVEWHGEQGLHVERDRVVMHGASTDPACRPGELGVGVREGKLVCTRTLPPVAEGVRHVDLEIAGDAGEWRIPLDLEAFGREDQAARHLSGASDAKNGLTISVDSVARTGSAVVLELRVQSDRARSQLSIGGLNGMRDETTAMRLRDASGRTYLEHSRNDARDQLPGHLTGTDVAIFEEVPAEAGDLTLEIDYVCSSEHEADGTSIALPLSEPTWIEIANTRVHVVGSRVAELPGGRGPAIALDLADPDWSDERRIIAPLNAKLDGAPAGVSWGGGIHGPAPKPVTGVLIPCSTPAESHTVSLGGAFVQHRGPWRIHVGSV